MLFTNMDRLKTKKKGIRKVKTGDTNMTAFSILWSDYGFHNRSAVQGKRK